MKNSKINVQTLQIRNHHGFEIDIDIFLQDTTKDLTPTIIFAHGFKGFKDWGGFPYMMNKFAKAGYPSVSFNFSHNGVESKNPMEFSRLDLFAQNTFSIELDDLNCVIDYIYENSQKFLIDKNKIILIGHSRGGGIAIIKSAEDKRIKCLVTLAAVPTFDWYTSRQKKGWREKGYFETLNTRTNQLMRLNSTLIEDLEQNKKRFDILNTVHRLNIPYLIIHGKEDLSVKFSDGEKIYKNSNKKLTEFFPVPNTGHTFGVVHPFQGTTKAFELVISKVLEFLSLSL